MSHIIAFAVVGVVAAAVAFGFLVHKVGYKAALAEVETELKKIEADSIADAKVVIARIRTIKL